MSPAMKRNYLLRSCDVAALQRTDGLLEGRWKGAFGPTCLSWTMVFNMRSCGRTVDIVMLDGIDPLAGDAVFPLGRLREPVEALRRADMIVISRAGQRRFDGLLKRLPKNDSGFLLGRGDCRWRPERPRRWIGWQHSAVSRIRSTFFETLRHAGVCVFSSRTFPDHHRYTREELQSLAKLALQGGGAGAGDN